MPEENKQSFTDIWHQYNSALHVFLKLKSKLRVQAELIAKKIEEEFNLNYPPGTSIDIIFNQDTLKLFFLEIRFIESKTQILPMVINGHCLYNIQIWPDEIDNPETVVERLRKLSQNNSHPGPKNGEKTRTVLEAALSMANKRRNDKNATTTKRP